MAEALERLTRCESFDSSPVSLVLGALNGMQEVCRTKAFACFHVDALSALLAPESVFPPS